jgi:hypothetical protein
VLLLASPCTARRFADLLDMFSFVRWLPKTTPEMAFSLDVMRQQDGLESQKHRVRWGRPKPAGERAGSTA